MTSKLSHALFRTASSYNGRLLDSLSYREASCVVATRVFSTKPYEQKTSLSKRLINEMQAVQKGYLQPVLAGGATAIFWTLPSTYALVPFLEITGIADVFASEEFIRERKSYNFSETSVEFQEENDWFIAEDFTVEFIRTTLFEAAYEEVIFREILPGIFLNPVSSAIFGDKEVEVFSHKMKFASLVSIVASSVLFGAAHLSNGSGLGQAIPCAVAGFAYGMLRHKFGIISSISAHTIDNLGITLKEYSGKVPHIIHENMLDVVI